MLPDLLTADTARTHCSQVSKVHVIWQRAASPLYTTRTSWRGGEYLVRRGRWAGEQCAMHSSEGTLQAYSSRHYIRESPSKVRPPMGSQDPHPVQGSVDSRKSAPPKRHLGRFSRFAQLTSVLHRPARYVPHCSKGAAYVRTVCGRCGPKSFAAICKNTDL